MMKKKHQVFVSSTYIDLMDERKELVQALLELDCIPSGMEMFPASNEDQWSLIKRVIDESDFYVLIIGNRYGSLSNEGISYTEKEYDYAITQNIPTLAFIHADPESIAFKYSELDPDKIEKLNKFREKVQKKFVKFYSSPEDLGGKLSRSLVQLMSRVERPGWIRGDNLAGDEARILIEKLRLENENLKKELNNIDTLPPPGTDVLASGTEIIDIPYECKNVNGKIPCSWDDLFKLVGPLLFNEATESRIKGVLVSELINFIPDKYAKRHCESNVYAFSITSESFHQVKTQLRALGLITLSYKKKTVRDTATYWTLTKYGDQYLTKLMAIRRS